MRIKAVKLILVGALSTLLFSLAVPAIAQEKAEKSGGGGEKKKTKIDFEDELVEGELKKPELFYLLQKKQFNFKRLIKLREDFCPNETGRGRST